MVAGEVVIVYRERGIAVEVENIQRRGGIINNPLSSSDVSDTAFRLMNVIANLFHQG